MTAAGMQRKRPTEGLVPSLHSKCYFVWVLSTLRACSLATQFIIQKIQTTRGKPGYLTRYCHEAHEHLLQYCFLQNHWSWIHVLGKLVQAFLVTFLYRLRKKWTFWVLINTFFSTSFFLIPLFSWRHHHGQIQSRGAAFQWHYDQHLMILLCIYLVPMIELVRKRYV